jgi:hypothetical protein
MAVAEGKFWEALIGRVWSGYVVVLRREPGTEVSVCHEMWDERDLCVRVTPSTGKFSAGVS